MQSRDRAHYEGKPLSDRAQTEVVMKSLIEGQTCTNDFSFGQGPFILSDIPKLNKDNPRGVIVGIDEAGRGSVLGPMVYGAAYWQRPKDEENEEPSKKVFADSKQLTEERRSFLYKKHILTDKSLGFAVRVLTAAEISRNMCRHPEPYNLNQMSHDAAMQIIQRLLDEGVNVEHCYIDTVGNPAQYQRKLEQTFANYSSVSFTVEAKADDKYPTCSAASVVAKVTRDSIIQHLSSSLYPDCSLGSGYPSDPTCKAWIQHQLEQDDHRCPVFGFSPTAAPLVRYSWNPIKQAFENKTGGTRTVTFAADDEEDEDLDGEQKQQAKRQRKSMDAFLGRNQKKRRYPYFARKGLQTISSL